MHVQYAVRYGDLSECNVHVILHELRMLIDRRLTSALSELQNIRKFTTSHPQNLGREAV